MGADEFYNKKSAKTAAEAFKALVDEALYKEGHDGYTGTIAEKGDFRMVEPHIGESPKECVRRLLEDESHWSQDKFGPAACIDAGPSQKVPGNRLFMFFGWAAS